MSNDYDFNDPRQHARSVSGKGRPCQNCGQRPAMTMWMGMGSAMDFVHGNYSWWCHPCCLKAQLGFAWDMAAQIPELETELAAALAHSDGLPGSDR